MVGLKSGSFDHFQKRIEGRKFYCFGCGDQAKMFFKRHSEIARQLTNIVDNDARKAGTLINVEGNAVEVLTFDEFADRGDRNSVLLVTSIYCVDMLAQLDQEPRLEGLETYINLFVDSMSEPSEFQFTKGERPKIPKKIHYCWFGGKPVPEKLKSYIRSWEKYCPDYEIVRWDESNYDVEKNLYMKQAYQAGRWGFVPDFARLDIIYEHGGIYLDTDVELLKPLDDLLYDEMFCGFEQSGYINFGNGFGAARGNKLIRELREAYESVSFMKEDGTLNMTPCVYYQESVLARHGVKWNGTYQKGTGFTVYPSEVLDAEDHWSRQLRVTEKTHALHHYASSWWNDPKMDAAAEKLRLNYSALLRRMEEI